MVIEPRPAGRQANARTVTQIKEPGGQPSGSFLVTRKLVQMETARKLHTFARRICINRHAHWLARYLELQRTGHARSGPGYTNEAYAIFPRYNVLEAVLNRIETLDPDALPSYEELRTLLIQLATSAASEFTKPSINAIHDNAMADERNTIAQLIRDASLAEVNDVEGLVYRRVLTGVELQTWHTRIETVWGVPKHDGWYPLGPKTHPSLIAISMDGIEDEISNVIRDYTQSFSINRLIAIRESGSASHEIDADTALIAYNGAEGFWIPRGTIGSSTARTRTR